jgi:hypothetical protein
MSLSLFVILSPSFLVILNKVKDLEGLRINFAKDLIFPVSPMGEKFFTLATGGGSE